MKRTLDAVLRGLGWKRTPDVLRCASRVGAMQCCYPANHAGTHRCLLDNGQIAQWSNTWPSEGRVIR